MLMKSGSVEEVEISAFALHAAEFPVEELRVMNQNVIHIQPDYAL